MRWILACWHACVMLIIGVMLPLYWVVLVMFGRGTLLLRFVRVGPIAYSMETLALCTVALAPTVLFSFFYMLRQISKDGQRFIWWRSLPFISNWYATQATVLLALVVLFGASWSSIISTDWMEEFGKLANSSQAPTPPSDAQLNYPALPLSNFDPYDMTLYDVDGNAVSMAQFKDKAVFLNFWATWCGYCLFEFPNIQNLYNMTKDEPNVAFILLSPEEPETVTQWVKEQNYTMPFYTIPREALPAEFTPSGFPTTFILAPDGRIAFRHSGFVAWDGGKTQRFLCELAATGKGSENKATIPADQAAPLSGTEGTVTTDLPDMPDQASPSAQ